MVDSDDEADDLESTSADDADDDSCLDTDSDDKLQEELNELAALSHQYPDLPPADTQIIGIKSKKVPRNILVTKQKTSGATANSSSNTRRNGRFKLTEVDKVSRTKCVLCNLITMMTHGSLTNGSCCLFSDVPHSS